MNTFRSWMHTYLLYQEVTPLGTIGILETPIDGDRYYVGWIRMGESEFGPCWKPIQQRDGSLYRFCHSQEDALKLLIEQLDYLF